MSTATSINSSSREQRLPPTLGLSAIMVSEISPQHHQEKLPLSHVHIPSNQNGSSSGKSEVSSISRLAHAASVRYGSPPASIGDVSYSMFSPCVNDPPTTGPSASTGTSKFRLEPKFGPNTKLRSNPPMLGRKRTAQSMALNNSNSAAITRNGLAGNRTPRRNHPDHHHRSSSHATTPASPRYADAAVFNLQGLSLRSPASTISGVNYNSTADYRATPNNAFVASPAATYSSFTPCGSNFSRVNTSFASTATVDGASPFRTYCSGSFGGSTLGMPGEIDIINDGSMPPPASIDISSSSPRIVPLTVLTHDSVPTSLTLASTQCHRRNLSFGSSVAGARPPMQHALHMGMSPLLLSVGSSSTSDDCHSGAVPATVRRNTDEIDDIFRNDHHMLTQTPQSRPPFVSVQYCPDSTDTTMSILADSPMTAFAEQKGTPSTATNKHGNHLKSTASVALPKVTLTPRSGVTSNVMAGLPSFPSPNSTSDNHQDMPIVLPRTSSRINRSIRINRSVPTPSRDVSLLTEAVDTESCSLDLSVDNASATKRNVYTTAINVISRSNTKSNVSDPIPTPRTCYSTGKTEMERLSSTMTSTPSAVSNVSLKEMIIDVDANIFPASSHVDIEVETESLSDGDDDEFFLAVPSSLVEEKHSEAGRTVRRSKLPRLLNGHPGNPIRNHTSMTSFGSQNTLLGTGYVMSSSSLRGMDALSNQLIFSECTGTSVNGYTMERVGSMTSIGLDLDRPSEKHNVPFAGRDLVTPPVMLEPSQPPALSPRFGSQNDDTWMTTTTTDDKTAAEADTRPSEDYLYYDSTKRTVA